MTLGIRNVFLATPTYSFWRSKSRETMPSQQKFCCFKLWNVLSFLLMHKKATTSLATSGHFYHLSPKQALGTAGQITQYPLNSDVSSGVYLKYRLSNTLLLLKIPDGGCFVKACGFYTHLSPLIGLKSATLSSTLNTAQTVSKL